MGISIVLLNETKKEFLLPRDIGIDLSKPTELSSNWHSPITMQQALFLLTNDFVSFKTFGNLKLSDFKNKTKLYEGMNTMGSWSGDKISWASFDDMYEKTKPKKGTKRYSEITQIAHNIAETKDNIKCISGKDIDEYILIDPYKSIGEKVRNMFVHYYSDYDIRGYQIGIPDNGNIDEERYFKIKFSRDPQYDEFRYLYGKDELPPYHYKYEFVEAPYKGGRAHFFGGMIDTKTKEGQKKLKDSKKVLKYL